MSASAYRVAPLTAALEDASSWVRGRAAEALGQIARAQAAAVLPLIAILNDRGLESGLRRKAAEALGKIDDGRTIETFVQALTDADYQIRWKSAEALGRIGDTRAAASLIQALQDSEWGVQWRAAEALGRIAQREPSLALRTALPQLKRGLRSENPEIFRTAIRQIEKATAQLRDLPLPSTSPTPASNTLPVPAHAPSTVPDALPLPADEPSPVSDGLPILPTAILPTPKTPDSAPTWWQRLRRKLPH